MVLFLFQLTLDGVLIGAIIWMITRKTEIPIAKENNSEELELLGVKVREMEAQMILAREKMEVQLTTLKKVCDEAARIVGRASSAEAFHDPSFEETELKLAAQLSREQIPTLRQIEKTRGRLETEIRVDLRSLLRDQLA